MNHIHRLIWNAATSTWVAVAENARGRGKGSSRKLVAAALSLTLAAGLAQAAPAGGAVTSGAGTINQSGAVTTIQQATPNLSLNWNSFNIGKTETVNFVQPSASAVAVNRILDTNASQILGRLNANGQVYLINPNGILFGQGSVVNVGGLFASSTGANASIINNGSLIANGGGSIKLEAANVVNTGLIQAQTVGNQQGSIILLGDMSTGTTTVGGTLDASAPNGGNGGFIETSAAHVKFVPGFHITTAASAGKTGTWLIDPLDFNIAPVEAGGDISGADLSSLLATNNITVEAVAAPAVNTPTHLYGTIGTVGDVNVTQPVTWAANTTLSLIAVRNINVNANITATGDTAGLVLSKAATFKNGSSATLSGLNPSVSIAGTVYTVINKLGDEGDKTFAPLVPSLQGIAAGTNLGGHYVLGRNIDAADAAGWTAGVGFAPIGDLGGLFIGTFDGMGHTITNLVIATPSVANVSLFGATGAASIIRNVGLVNVNISGASSVGGLVGSNVGSVTNTYATGLVQGSASSIGGLMGSNTGNVSNSYSTATVMGTSSIGGLMGSSTTAIVDNCYATGTVTGSDGSVGGLMGSNSSVVTNSYATGNVKGTSSIGGLMGSNTTGTVSNSYATGNVEGTSGVGGLIGTNSSFIYDIYASGDVNGTSGTGGLAGTNSGAITRSYASGTVNGHGNLGTGALIGTNSAASITFSYWNTDTSGQPKGIGTNVVGPNITPLTDPQMVAQAPYLTNYDFVNTWYYIEGIAPVLRSLMTELVVTAQSKATTYTGLAYSGTNGVTYSVMPTTIPTGLTYSYTNSDASPNTGPTNAGTYSIVPAGLVSSQLYLVSYVSGKLVIGKAANTVIVTANSDTNKVYTGTTQTVSGFTATGLLNGELASVLTGVSASGSGKNVGSYTTVATGTDANYTLTLVDGSLAIAKANATVTANSDTNKVYTGTTQTVSGFSATGLLNGETVSVLTGVSASGSGKNVGTYTTTASGTDTNYNLTLVDGSLAIGKANATVTANSDTSKVYNGVTQSVSGFSATGLLNGETASVLTGVTASGSGKNVGTYTTKATGTDTNYNLTLVDGTLAIAKANATVTANSNTSLTYTGTTQTVSGFSANGLLNGETTSVLTGVSASGSGKNVGTYTTTAAGTDTNYNLTFAPGSLVIGKANATVTITANSDTSKVYTGTTQTVSGFTAMGLLNGENASVLNGVSAGASGTNAGDYVATAGVGSYSGNYSLSFVNGKLTIAKAAATVTANSNTALTYTGATQTVSGFSATGLLNGETASVLSGVTASGTGKNVGSFTTTAAGTDTNYNLTLINGTLAIAKANATVTANSDLTKAYTGVAQTVSGFSATGLLNGEGVNVLGGVTAGGSGTNAGDYVAAAGVGTYSGNYNLSFADGKLTIGKATAPVTVTADSATVTYNGVSQSVNTFKATGFVNGETASVLGGVSATGSGKNAGNHPVTALGVDANYTLLMVDGNLAINPAPLTISAKGNTKIYDGTTAATVTLGDNRFSGDQLSTAYGSAAFVSKDIGVGKTVLVSGLSLQGADAANYTFNTSTSTTANIFAAKITVQVENTVAHDKVYDGNTTASLTGGRLVGLQGLDAVGLIESGYFASKNVGNTIAVTATDVLNGIDAANYTLVQPTGLSANITPRPLAVTATGNNKVYDGTLLATVNLSDNRLAGDLIQSGYTSASFADKNSALGKPLSVLGINLAGVDAANYSFNASASTTANITQAPITLTTLSVNKVYDASLQANGQAVIASGTLFANDSLSGGAFNFADKNVGDGNKVVIASGVTVGEGGNNSNYAIAYANNTSSTITPALVVISGVAANNKSYDATTRASLRGAPVIAALGQDQVSVQGPPNAQFVDSEIGLAKAVSVSGYTLGGIDSGNYTVRQPGGLLADISEAKKPDIRPYAIDQATPFNVSSPLKVSMVFSAEASTSADASSSAQGSDQATPSSVSNALKVTRVSSTEASAEAGAVEGGVATTPSDANAAEVNNESSDIRVEKKTAILQIVDGGIRLPPNILVVSEEEKRRDIQL